MTFGMPKCPECDKSVDMREYVEVQVTLVRNDMPTPLGTEIYCADCWYDIEDHNETQKDRS